MKTLTIFLALFTLIFPINNFLRAQCAPPTAQADLDIANVRARIINSGYLWYSPYEVPINSGKNALFAGGLWIGAMDASNNMCVAVENYQSSGHDFWPGPLDTITASVSAATCLQYDHLWKINRQDVINFIGGSPATSDMLTYPGNGTGTQAHFLAPYYDVNGDGIYNSTDGDYPDFGFNSNNCCDILHGDQAIWWVINDRGNFHGNGVGAFGIEIHCQVFAFNTVDPDINNTTFYQYKIINRSSTQYVDTYFGLFIDTKLGNDSDDYIGCDVPRSMGYCYNGDADDEGPTGYGLHPPTVGIDFLQSPVSDSCGISMQKFMYFNNDFTVMGVPTTAGEYYTYLKGLWKDGTPLTYGGNGKGGGNGATNIPCRYMFPGNSDHQWEYGTGGTCGNAAPPRADWDEYIAGNVPWDRRFLMSSGPFILHPGAVHCITAAAIWTQDTTSISAFPSLAVLQAADDKVQMFFDSCFNENLLVINEPESQQASVFPNPVSDLIEVRLDKAISDGKFIVYDIAGRNVKQVAIKNEQKFSVSCKDLSQGVYVYRILLPNGNTTGGKFVKN